MKKLISLLFVLLCLPAFAQSGLVTVSGSNVKDSSGALITNATMIFTPVDLNGRPMSFRVGNGGQVVTSPIQVNVTNGVFTTPLADTSLSSPQNVCFSIKVIDNTSGNSLLGPGYTCVQPAYNNSWCVNGSCNFDNFVPSTPSIALVATGPPGPGFTYRGAWAANTAYSPNDLVTQAGAVYEAGTAFTSGPSFNAAQWNLWVPGSTTAFGNSIIPSTDNAFDLGSASFRVRNLYATGLQLSLPTAGASIDNYSYFGATYNASTLVQGLILGKSSNNRWGIDWGLGSKGIATRLFAPAGQSIEFCFHAVNVTPTSPADLQNCPETLTSGGVFFNQPVTFSSPLSFTSLSVKQSPPTNILGYGINFNGNNTYTPAGNLLAGTNWLVAGGNAWGQDIHNDAALSKIAMRTYFPTNNGVWQVCPYAASSPPTNDAGFLPCVFSVTDKSVNLNTQTPTCAVNGHCGWCG